MARDEAILDPPPARPGPPPLRIHHILVATAVTAVLLAVMKSLIRNDAVTSNILESGTGILSTVSSGVAVTLVAFGIAWRRRGRAFFNQPGHWLLLYETFLALLCLMFVVALLLRLLGLEEYRELPLHAYGFVLCVGWPILNIVAAWKGFDSRWWRWFFIVQGVTFIAILLLAFSGAAGPVWLISAMPFMMLIAAVIADRRAGRSRDWAHWLGVLLMFTFFAAAVGTVLWEQLVGASAAGS